jgi:hypothetical protein
LFEPPVTSVIRNKIQQHVFLLKRGRYVLKASADFEWEGCSRN